MLTGQGATRDVSLEIREQELIHAAGSDATAGSVADDGRILAEPERLHGLNEGLRRQPGHAAAGDGDGFQFCPALWVDGRSRLLAGQAREALGEHAHGVTGLVDTFEKSASFLGFCSRETCACRRLNPGEARAEHVLVSQHDVGLRVRATAAALEIVPGPGPDRTEQTGQARYQSARVERPAHLGVGRITFGE